METNQLKYFKAVAISGKITAAAQEMFVTAPAISASIAALEQELNTKLFDRVGKRLVLNRQGEIFLDHVNYILSSVADAQNSLQKSLSDRKGGVAAGSTSANIFADLFCDFAVKHPDIYLTTSTVQPKDINFARLNASFSFLFAAEMDIPPSYTESCESLILFEDAPALMLHPDHPLAKKDCVSPKELLDLELIWPRINANVKTCVLNAFSDLFLPMPVFSYHNHQTAYTLVKRNAGMALLTTHSKNAITEDLVFLPVDLPNCRWKQILYWKKDHVLTEEDSVFLEFIKDYYSVP